MKLYAKIISMLLVAGLASAGAQSAGNYASNFYLKGSFGIADPREKGFLGSGGKKLGSTQIYSFEAGAFFSENLSFGFEYSFFNTDASLGGNVDGAYITDNDELVAEVNSALNSLGYAGGLASGLISIKEDFDADRFMFVFNYNYKLSPDFTLFFNGGLGVLNVEHTLQSNLKAKKTASSAAVDVSIKSKSDETVFAYQLGAGLGYHFTEAVSLYGQARYLASLDLEFNHEGYKYDAKGSALAYEIGLQYSF